MFNSLDGVLNGNSAHSEVEIFVKVAVMISRIFFSYQV